MEFFKILEDLWCLFSVEYGHQVIEVDTCLNQALFQIEVLNVTLNIV